VGATASTRWQVTLCDPIWHAGSHSSEVLVAQTATPYLYLFTLVAVRCTSKLGRWRCDNVGVGANDSLVGILASLAAEATDDISHDTSRDTTLEDVDAVLSQVVLPLSAEDRREIAEESLEMSQRVWDDEDDLQPANAAAAAAAAAVYDDDVDDMYVYFKLCGLMV